MPSQAHPIVFYLVVPCYNEELALPETARSLKAKFSSLIERGEIAQRSRVLFVDDGSRDRTWQTILGLHDEDPTFSGVKLSHNRGHQNALLAGLLYAADKADAIGSMDADLQDDVNALDEMISRVREGYDVVYGVRNDRTTDTLFKRKTAQAFYRFQAKMGVETVYNHADYRVMSRRAVKALAEFDEVNLFLRGLVPLIGFKSCNVYYSRGKRVAGESKYGLAKMFGFAFDGITSFSVKPMHLISLMGLGVSVVSLLSFVYIFIGYVSGSAQPGWTSTMASVWLLGGLQLLAIGMIGEYLGKAYLEVKARPRYFIEETVDDAPPEPTPPVVREQGLPPSDNR